MFNKRCVARWLVMLASAIAASAQAQEAEVSAEVAPSADAEVAVEVEAPSTELPPSQPSAETVVFQPAEAPIVAAPPVEGGYERVVGIGTTVGAGAAAQIGSLFAGFALELPTIEALIYIDETTSIDIVIPIVNTAIVSALIGGLALNVMVYADFSVGDDVRFIGGPGLGFSFVTVGSQSGGSVRIGSLLGGEFLTGDRLFGFRLMTRPFLDLAFAGSGFFVGGGALLELGFNFYVTR